MNAIYKYMESQNKPVAEESKEIAQETETKAQEDQGPQKSGLVWSSMNGELIISNCDFTGAILSPENKKLIDYLQSLN
ncbi:unnamed protein product [Blepharisma stoltei]|uniref:Uncharacterized protein n=1 Tax=Blepharisma stoltei TaxID=1481888 RepID=A0AAU9JE37_9CILI|nr:unnamed protein product [Blepharisma stoltei]